MRWIDECDWSFVAGMLLVLALLPAVVSAEVRLPALLADHMVLQRDQPIRIWGYAARGESVRVNFRGDQHSAVADAAGHWSVTLAPQSAGGPDALRITGRNSIELQDVLIGDVWVASGQSNMEFALKDSDGAAAAIAASHDPMIRLFRVQHDAAVRPKRELRPGAWKLAEPRTAAESSAVAFLFAKRLRERYHIPIGIIEAFWGGTYAESWMSSQALQRFPEYADRLRELRSFGPKDETEYAQYAANKARWNAAHRSEDRGTREGRAVWADPRFDVSAWPLIQIPRPDSAWGTDFDGFDGTIWFRRDVTIAPEVAGLDLELHLGVPYHTLQAFYDGEPIETVSATMGIYRVAGYRVRAGRGVITQRLTGGGGYIMLSGKPEDVYALAGHTKIPLAGPWSHQPGTPLTDFPKPVRLFPYYGFPGITVLSNAMIEPLTPAPIKGVIWYQGESNVGAAPLYRRLFPALINDWRRRWGNDFPFLFVQLAGFSADGVEPGDSPLAELREAQESALTLARTGMATAVDIGNLDDVHPKNKAEVARRLSLVAAKIAYGDEVVASGPTFRSLHIDGDRIRIGFDNRGTGLTARDRYGYVRGFAIATAGGPFVWAQAEIDHDEIIVHSDSVKAPVAVRYGWANTPDGNLYNREGLPAIPFRSDDPHLKVETH